MLAVSEPYLLDCRGHLDVSGIEYVHASPNPGNVASLDFASGIYEVSVYVLDWDDVQNRSDNHPDFIVLVAPSRSTMFSDSLLTFGQ